ncbi:Polycystin-1 [Manis javanica]|nr:Polycystin-1 [Manis javanica]
MRFWCLEIDRGKRSRDVGLGVNWEQHPLRVGASLTSAGTQAHMLLPLIPNGQIFYPEIGVLPKDDLYCEIPEWGVNMELQLGGLKAVGAQPPGFQPSLSSRLSKKSRGMKSKTGMRDPYQALCRP